MLRGLRARQALLLLLIFGMAPLRAQTYRPPTSEGPAQYPPTLPPRRGPAPPPLRLVRVAQIPVPGPLPGGPLRLEGEGVRVPLQQGEAVVPLDPGGAARVQEDGVAPGVPAAEAWTSAPDGRDRYVARPGGLIEAEKRCRLCRRGWRRGWRVKVGAAVPSPPLVFGSRVCFAALDNRVYCLRRTNGHRAWATDVGDRASRPLALWTGPVRPGRTESGRLVEPQILELLLVVPDGGEALRALDAYDGRPLADYDVPASEGRLVSPAVVAPGGRVVVARQGYQDQEASIEVLEIVPAEEKPPKDETSGPGPRLPVP